MINSSNRARITHGSLHPRFFAPVRGKIAAMNASESDLVKQDRLLSPRGRLREFCCRRRKDFDLLPDEHMERIDVFVVALLC